MGLNPIGVTKEKIQTVSSLYYKIIFMKIINGLQMYIK